MRKIFISILFLILTVCLLTAAPSVAAGSDTSGTCGEQITWHFDSATGTLTFSGQGELNPDGYGLNPSSRFVLKHLIVEEGITALSGNAFRLCTDLISVKLPDSLEKIDSATFSNCTSLREVSFGSGLTTLGSFCFYNCKSLTEITIPQGVTQIESNTFYGCTQLSKPVLHDNITLIDSSAFRCCESLESIKIPENTTTIRNSAFNGCTNLSSVILNSKLTRIESAAFSSCTSLTQIHIPDSVVRIDNEAFENCTSLRQVTIGSGLSEIGIQPFAKCTALTGISLSANNEHFQADQGAFYHKAKAALLFIVPGFAGEYSILPGTVSIQNYAAKGCCYLTKVTIPEGVTIIYDQAFEKCTALTEVVLPSSLETIRWNAFAYCTSLAEITFPENIANIENRAFAECSGLKKISFNGAPPTFAFNSFNNVTATVYYLPHHGRWIDHLRSNYGGTFTWFALPDGDHVIYTHPGTPPGCTDEGFSDAKICWYCGVILLESTTLPPTGHSYGPWVDLAAPTTHSMGLRKRTCTSCGMVDEQLIPMLGSTPTEPTDPTVPPTEPTEPPVTEPLATEPPVTEPPATQPTESTPSEPTPVTPAKDSNMTLILVIAFAGITVAAGAIIAITLYKRNKS